MKKLVTVLAVVSLIAIGAAAYGHGTGTWGGGHMMGSGMMGYGGHMMGTVGYGGHMMGSSGFKYDKKFLDETTELRKELHNKRFEYFESLRDTETTPKTLTNLEKEVFDLQFNIREKAPRTAFGTSSGYGCW